MTNWGSPVFISLFFCDLPTYEQIPCSIALTRHREGYLASVMIKRRHPDKEDRFWCCDPPCMLWSKIAAIRSQLHYNIDFDNVWMYLVDLYTAINI